VTLCGLRVILGALLVLFFTGVGLKISEEGEGSVVRRGYAGTESTWIVEVRGEEEDTATTALVVVSASRVVTKMLGITRRNGVPRSRNT
jgi:hypothetical protein